MSGWVAEFLVATTLLMALVLLVRPLVRRAFGAGAAYAIWLVPGLCLLLPKGDALPSVAMAVAPMDIVFASAAEAPVGAGWLVWPWAAGALLFAGWHLIAYRRFLSRALSGAERLNTSGTPVLATDAVDGPAAAGLHNWRIFVPRDFQTRFTADERELAIRHELRHLSAGHLVSNALALGMLALHWFNPLAYRAYRAFRQDQELACDEAVVAASGCGERATYGAALVKSAAGRHLGRGAPITTCPMTSTDTLKRRLSMIKTHKKTTRKTTIGTVVAVGLTALAGSTLTATSVSAADAVASTQTVIIKRVAGKQEAEAAAGAVIDSRCGDEAQVAETKKSLRAALEASSGKPVKSVTINCGSDSRTPAERAASLEKAIAHVSASSQFDPQQRAKIVAALNDALAKAKAGQ